MAQKAAPTVLKPAAPWTIDYAKDSCGVIRKYGTGADQVEMVFLTVPRSAGATLVLITSPEKGPGSSQPNYGTATITLPGGLVFDEAFGSARLGETGRRLLNLRLDDWQLDLMIAADRIEVDAVRHAFLLRRGIQGAGAVPCQPAPELEPRSRDTSHRG
jgi:hypothetical protein